MMNMKMLAAQLMSKGKMVLGDFALDLAYAGVQLSDLRMYATDIGVQDVEFMIDDEVVLDAILALEQECQFS